MKKRSKKKLVLEKQKSDPCLYPGCHTKTTPGKPWCKVHKSSKVKLPFDLIRKGVRIVLGCTSNHKGTVTGTTFQDVHGHPQLFYVVRLDQELSTADREVNVHLVLIHPDNLTSLAEQDRSKKEEATLDQVVEIGQSDNSFKIKTNAPDSHVELVRYKIERRGRLTARKMVKRLKRLGWRARVLEEKEVA